MWLAAHVVGVVSVDVDDALLPIRQLLRALLPCTFEDQQPALRCELIGACIITLSSLYSRSVCTESTAVADVVLALNWLCAMPASRVALKAVSTLLGSLPVDVVREACQASGCDILVVGQAVEDNLASWDHVVRVYTLRVLCSLPQLPYVDDAEAEGVNGIGEPESGKSGLLSGRCQALDLCLEVESYPMSVEGERPRNAALARIGNCIETRRLPKLYQQVHTPI